MDKKLEKIFEDIKSIKIQGATNVADAVIDGMLLYASGSTEENLSELITKTLQIGKLLSIARENEPLARNAVKYIENQIKDEKFDSRKDFLVLLKKSTESFNNLLVQSKRSILDFGVEELQQYTSILTHCHSTTAVNILRGIALINKDLRVFATETRPLFQGRLTSKDLIDSGIDTTLIIDNAVPSILYQEKYGKVEAVIIGCDELSFNGDLINKIGSLSIALSCQKRNIPLYVVTTLLKINRDWDGSIMDKEVELRSSDEVWKEAPKGLKIVNPAFDIVPNELITGYITDYGKVDNAKDLQGKLNKHLGWAG